MDNNLQAVIDAARRGQEPIELEVDTNFRIIHTASDGVQILDIEKYRPTPARKRGTVTIYDVESFNTLLADNAIPWQTTVYVTPDADKPAIVAVINGHGRKGPGWGDFRISFGFRPMPQWTKWKAIDGRMMAQVDFAEFVEDNLADVASPDGATMMEIVTYLQATRSVEFKSGIRLANGAVQLTNLENVEARVGPGNTAVPEVFELGLAPFFGVAPFRIPARFRYRIVDRKLTLGFKLQRIETVMEAVVKDIVAGISAPEGVPLVYGVAP